MRPGSNSPDYQSGLIITEEGGTVRCTIGRTLATNTELSKAVTARVPGLTGLPQENMKAIRIIQIANVARYCLVVISNSKSWDYMFMNNIEFAPILIKMILVSQKNPGFLKT